MKRKNLLLAALALVLVLGACIGPAYAYFTTYAEARGGYPIHMGAETEIGEQFSQWTKHVTITSEEDSAPAYVRVRATWPEEFEVQYLYEDDTWSQGEDGWMIYNGILNGGEATPTLDVYIGNVPAEAVPGESFSVIVYYETTPVTYDESGAAEAPDWNIILDSGSTEGGNG